MNNKKTYYKLTTVDNFGNYNYIKYESNVDGNKKPSLNEYLIKVKPYLKPIAFDFRNLALKKSSWQ